MKRKVYISKRAEMEDPDNYNVFLKVNGSTRHAYFNGVVSTRPPKDVLMVLGAC